MGKRRNIMSLTVYINGMMHSCLEGGIQAHQIGVCPARKKFVAVFVERYKQKTWTPVDEINFNISTVPDPGRGVVGVMKYVKSST